jgi:hypothetical protein
MPVVRLDAAQLRHWESFHTIFATAFGFPAFYGRNMDAWIDCMTCLDSPEDGMTAIHGSQSDPVVLHLDNVDAAPAEIFDASVECSAFVNWRRMELGEPAILMLAFYRTR